MTALRRLGVVMDPIGAISYAKDSTLAMLLAAQARGFALVYLEQRDLLLRDGVALGRMRALSVRADPADWFTLGEPAIEPLSTLACILMRKDPPFDTEYIYSTYILERAEAQGVLIVNRPRGLRDMNEKVYTAWFPQCCAPTLITRDMGEMAGFLHEQHKIVCKPLDGMGGTSVFRVREDDVNRNVIVETVGHHGARTVMAQRFIPEIVDGDKRIVLIAGEPVPHSLARIPKPGETRGNLAAGARGVARPLSPRDRLIAETVGAKLWADGLLVVGLDVIGDYLTEINVTSPTGFVEITKQTGFDVADRFAEALVHAAT